MIEEKVRQVKLEPNELTYLLHTHGAKQVAGLDDEYFFPTDTAVLRERLATGLDSLKQNGWLQPDKSGQGFNTNISMMLLTAVLVAPEKQLIVQRMIDTERFQIFTYSWAQEYLVEQYRTADGSYVLTDLQQERHLIERLLAAFDIEAIDTQTDPIKMPLTTFENILSAPVEQRVQQWADNLPQAQQFLAPQLATISRLGLLAMQETNKPEMPVEIALLQDNKNEKWLMFAENSLIQLEKATPATFRKRLQLAG